MRFAGSKAAWAVLAVVLVGALAVAALGTRPPANDREAVLAVAATVKCPICIGESVAVSEAEISQTMRAEIAAQLDAGRSPDEIRAFFVERYGPEVLLDPGTDGASLAVWLVPAVLFTVAVAGLVVVLRRWRRRGPLHATDEDRALVADALSLGPEP